MGIKYFSGTATYRKQITVSAAWLKGNGPIWLDLGDVKDVAVVTINGSAGGTLWHAPYRVDITSALKAGINQIEVKVVSEWANRLIGDLQANASTHIAYATWKAYSANSPLQPSGLIGPLSIEKSVAK